MTLIQSTGTENVTLYFDAEGQPEYPCWCGEVHRGDYGLYDFMHHNCPHNEGLAVLDPEAAPDQLICVSCGRTFPFDTRPGGDE